MQYAVYISGKGTRIRKALERNKSFQEKVKLVVSDDEANLAYKKFFEEGGAKYYLVDLKKIEAGYTDKNLYLSDELDRLFRKYKIDYCFSFGGHILKGQLLEDFAYRIINFHPAILPRFPGLNAIDQAIENKARYLGNTAHFIDRGVDTGPIILQSITLADNFYQNGYDAILDEQITLLFKVEKLLAENRLHIEGEKVKIEGANYQVSHIYPDI